MKEQKIRSIFTGEIGELTEQSKKMAGFDKDAIHDLRVSFKSLRSFIRLLREQESQPDLRLPKKLKRLYHIAGAIRDAQLRLEKDDLNGLDIPGYCHHLHKVISRQKKQWNDHYSKDVFRKLKKRIANSRFAPVDVGALSIFINSRMSSIDAICKQKDIDDNQLHTIRKLVKDILYTTKIAQREWKTGGKKISRLDISLLDDIATKIGDYNDDRMLKEQLLAFSSGPTSAEKRKIKTFCAETSARLQTAKPAIILQVRQMLATLQPL